MSEATFDQLRTKEQLGYIVFTSLKKIAHNVLSLRIIVQSSHKDPVYLDGRIESFLSQYYETDLLPMTEEKLTHFIDSFKEKMLEKPKNLDEVSPLSHLSLSHHIFATN
jgi:insulysin